MRLMQRHDRSYVTRVIKETRALVNSRHAIHTKIALIESAIMEEADKIQSLENLIEGAPPTRQVRLQKAIELRKRALGHYRCTVKSLLLKEQRSLGLRMLPSFLGESSGQGEIQFMEFSS